MNQLSFSLLSIAFALSSAQNCTLSFDGRIPQSFTPQTFTTNASLFNPSYDIGENLTWAKIITFPSGIPGSKFDLIKSPPSKPVSLSLSDDSIFRSSTEFEPALRRAELLVNGKPNTVSGHKTWHFSFRLDLTRPLNLTHEYVLAFHEAQDFQADFWSLKAGTPMLGLKEGMNANGSNIWVEGWKWDVPTKIFYITDLLAGEEVWHNFGIGLDYVDNLIQIFYSRDNDTLLPVTQPTYNNLSGKAPTTLGETHFGLQKRPIGATLDNFLSAGYQEEGIDEALFLGGIFQDDSSAGCVTL